MFVKFFSYFSFVSPFNRLIIFFTSTFCLFHLYFSTSYSILAYSIVFGIYLFYLQLLHLHFLLHLDYFPLFYLSLVFSLPITVFTPPHHFLLPPNILTSSLSSYLSCSSTLPLLLRPVFRIFIIFCSPSFPISSTSSFPSFHFNHHRYKTNLHRHSFILNSITFTDASSFISYSSSSFSATVSSTPFPQLIPSSSYY